MSQTALGGIATWLIAPSHKVDMPGWQGVDVNQVQNETIGSIKSSLPGAEAVGAEINQFNLKQQLSAFQQTSNLLAPGELSQVQGINSSLLRGEVPADVQAQLQRQSVAGAFGRGYGPGSQIASNDYLRNFGLTSLGLQQQGEQGFSNLMAMGPKAPLFDLTNLFFSPQQRLQNAMQQAQIRYNISLQRAQIAAAPDPNMANIAQGIDSDIKMVEQAALSYAGGGMGGMGGGGGGSAPPAGQNGGAPKGSPNWGLNGSGFGSGE